MVDFRKVLLLLVVVLVATVSAQVIQPSVCTAQAGVPPPVRAEGVAEEVGQVVIICQGGTSTAIGTAIPTINVQVTVGATSITSRLLISGGTASEALLLIDEPAPANQFLATAAPPFVGSVLAAGGGFYTPSAARPNVFAANQLSDNSLTWLNVPFDAPGTTPVRILRLANVRANASKLAPSSTLIPSAINMYISISGTASLTLSNTQLVVAYVQYGLKFSATAGTYKQCTPGIYAYNMTFSELFGTAFRPNKGAAVAFDQNMPGSIYNTESMFTNSLYTSPYNSAGVATQGTRLIARFSNVPEGVSLYVPGTAAAALGGVGTGVITYAPAGSALTLALVGAGVNGSTTAADGTVGLTAGAGAVVYEVMAATAGAIESAKIPVFVSYKSSPQAKIGTATVSGNYAPTTTVYSASVTEPAPRFVDNPTSATTFTISSCKTNLLFPYVTNFTNFDTGIAISNTSKDPWGTVGQSGICTLYFYGTTVGGGTLPAAQAVQPTPVVAAGAQYVNLVSIVAPQFTGYLIASCDFQYAHGFAFISNMGDTKWAEGYLALVMDSAIGSRTGYESEVLSH